MTDPHSWRGDLRWAGVAAVLLGGAGALLGLVWSGWSPAGPAAEVLGHGLFIPDETEAFVAGDGRYLVIALVVGLVAALVAWWAVHRRGPVVLAGLVIGGLVGSLLMELIGHLTGGGSASGRTYQLSGGGTERYTTHLPLSLHAHGLLFVEPAVIALVYGLLVAFAVRDDLGRPDPGRAERSDRAVDASVDAGDHAQHGGRHGDAAGALQQGDLAP